MKLRAKPAHGLWRLLSLRALGPGCAVLLLAALCVVSAASAQAPQGPLETVGRLSGHDVTVAGALSFDQQSGRSTAILTSGSEVTVRSGQALIELDEGGAIAVCGPAHFSVLKSGGAITVALDYGRVHPMLTGAMEVTVYTPLVVATTVAINQNQRDATIGLDQDGTLCVVSARGAMRIEQQLSGQSLLVPQGGSVNLAGGQLSSSPSEGESCNCELLVSRSIPPKELELSVPIKPPVDHPAVVPPPVESDPPIYKVYMPPLTFNAAAPEPPPAPDPDTILLVREVRLQPEVVFQGHVEPAAVRSAPSPSSQSASAAQTSSKPKSNGPGLFARLANAFRHGRHEPCEGTGCSAPES